MLEFLRRVFSGSKARKNSLWVGLQAPHSMPGDAKGYVAEGYEINATVYRCIRLLAESMGQVPMYAADAKGKELPATHPLARLLARPNPMQSWSVFAGYVTAFRKLTGNAPIEILRAGTGDNAKPRELWPWQPYDFKAVEGRMLPKAWVYDNGSPGQRRVWDVDQLTGQSDMLMWREFSASNKYFGMAPLAAGAKAADQNNAAANWNHRMLGNNCVPSGVLTSEQVLSDPQFARLKETITETYSGTDNARRPMLLDGGLSWVQMALTPADLDFIQGRNLTALEIAEVFGVPAQLVPIPGSQTFANFMEARLALWEDCVLPLARDLAQEITRAVNMPNAEVRVDVDDIPALAPRRAEKWNAVGSASFLTTNEKRIALGYEPLPVPEADEVLVPAGLVPLGLDITIPPSAPEGQQNSPQKPDGKPEDSEEGGEEEDSKNE